MPMASSFEKSVKGGTKIKLAAPKSKYVEHILVATHAGEQGVAEVFRVLQNRLRDSTWTIVFKSLIIVHFMIREGEPNVTLKYLSNNPARKLAINNFTEVQTQGRNICAYAEYLVQRVKSFESTKFDYVRAGEGRLVRLSVDKGLLRETASVQDQIRALLRCDFLTLEPENDISLTAFRLLVMDLLVLFHVMNEGMVNILQHFFEMSKTDAEVTLAIYRGFTKQCESVVKYLSVARNYEHVTRLEVPTLKHAPTTLTSQLEEYVKDPDFEVMRRQYVAQQQAKRGGGKIANGSNKFFEAKANSTSKVEAFPEPKAVGAASANKGPAPDLIDFFESIDQNQTQMSTNPFQQPQPAQQIFNPQQGILGQQASFDPQQALAAQPMQQSPFSQSPAGMPNQPSTTFTIQQTAMLGQQNFNPVPNQPTGNPFIVQHPANNQPPQPDFTGAGFGGFTAQPQNSNQDRFTPGLTSVPQNNVPSFQLSQQSFGTGSNSPASSNPFRQSMMPNATGTTGTSYGNASTATTSLSAQSTNPFSKMSQQTPPTSNSPFVAPNPQFSNLTLNTSQHPAQPLISATTGTNPFARTNASPAAALPFSSSHGGVTTNVTGSTNPFRQSQFVNQATGAGWQAGPQGTIAGMHPDQIQTTSVFPRPGQTVNMQSQPTGWPQ